MTIMTHWQIRLMLCASLALALVDDARAAGCAVGVGGGGGSSSENFGIAVDVVGSGGGDAASPGYSIQGTVGQVVRNVQSTSPGFSDGAGLWDVLFAFEGEDPVYDPVGCAGEVLITNLADYQAYVDSDYGRDGADQYQHLRVVSSLSDATIALQSPCRIRVEQGLSLQASSVLIDARDDVRLDDYASIDATAVCIESDEQSVNLGRAVSVVSGELTVQSRHGTDIDRAFEAHVTGELRLGSSQGPLNIGRDLTIRAGIVGLEAKGSIIVDDGAYAESQASISVVSHSADQRMLLGKHATLTADEIRLSSAGRTEVGQRARLEATSSITIESTGTGPQARATIQAHATVAAGTDIGIAGGRLFVGSGTTTLAGAHLEIDAADGHRSNCLINPNASFSYATVSGACAAFLP